MWISGRAFFRSALVLMIALSLALPVVLSPSAATAVDAPSTSKAATSKTTAPITAKSKIATKAKTKKPAKSKNKNKKPAKSKAKSKIKIPKIKWNPATFVPNLQTVVKSGPPLSKMGCHGSPLIATAQPCLFGREDLPKVLLFGDSHAAHWYGPINKVQQTTSRFALESLTKAACSAIDSNNTFVPSGPPVPGEVVQADKVANCKLWRKDALHKIANHQFGRLKLVILSPLVPREGVPKKRLKDWKRGYLRTLKVVSPNAQRVVILRDMPLLPRSSNVVKCLTKYKAKSPEKCGAPAKRALNPTAWKITRDVAKRFKNVHVVDLASSTCKRNYCTPFRGRYIKVRDAHHYTHPYMARFMTEPVRKVLRKVV